MKIRALLNILSFAGAVTVLSKIGFGARSIPKRPLVRIWVQYKSGQKYAVRDLLQAAGAIFHYDFTDLESFVVTLPEDCMGELDHQPTISDYWYATMLSKNEPVLHKIS